MEYLKVKDTHGRRLHKNGTTGVATIWRHLETPQAGRNLPQSPDNALILVSGFQNHESKYTYSVKPPSKMHFVAVDLYINQTFQRCDEQLRKDL